MTPFDYETARKALGAGVKAALLAKDLLLIRGFDDDSIALVYRKRALATFFPGGVVLRSGGSMIEPVRIVLNEVLAPHGWFVYRVFDKVKPMTWGMRHMTTDHTFPFEEGMVMAHSAVDGKYVLPLDIGKGED